MSQYYGDIDLGDTVQWMFTTVDADGIPTALAGTPTATAYTDGGVTQSATGVTLTEDFDGVTGLNQVSVVASGGNGFATGENIEIVLDAGTVDGNTVVGYAVGSFSIENRSPLRPTTAGTTLDVAATGEAGVDLGNVTGTLGQANVGWVDANSRVDVGAFLGTAVAAATASGEVNSNVTEWLGTAVTAATAGVPNVNTTTFLDVAVAAATASGEIAANVTEWEGTPVATPTVAGVPEVDITHVEGATTLSELSQGIPAATPTLSESLMLGYMALRNEMTISTTTLTISNNAGTVITKKALTDTGTYTEAEAVSGP